MNRSGRAKVEAEAQSVLNAIRQIVKNLRQASKSAERTVGLSSAQLFVLQKISESGKPLSINELAASTFTHQSSVSVVVGKLVKQKLVARFPSKYDARSLEIAIAKKGRALLRKAPPLFQDSLMRGIFRLSSTERRGLMKGLNALVRASGFKRLEPSLFFVDEKED